MKLVSIWFHFEFSDRVERIVDEAGIQHFVRFSMIEGKDTDGKHYGTQVYPGNVSVIQAQVSEENLEELMQQLGAFKREKEAHQHLQALVLPIERRL